MATESVYGKHRDSLNAWIGDRDVAHIVRQAVSIVDRYATWLVLLGSFGVVWLLYGDAIGFSFLFDDTIDLTRVEGRSFWSLLASSEGYSYYRPIPFVIWKALREIQGHYDQATLHALPLIVHAVSGWLLYLLVRRLGAGHWAVFPALLFLTAPFHYQSVPIVGTLFHPLAGMAILASLTLYLEARSQTGEARAWHIAALGMTVVALWAHESGIVIAALIVGLEGLLLWRVRSRRPSTWLAGHIGASVLFFVTWLTVEKTPFGETTTIAELRPKGLFFLQGFTYPLSAQLVWLSDTLGVAPGVLEAGVVALLLVGGAYAVSAWRTGQRVLLAVPAIALSIAVVASAPSMARLSWPYVENSPRLLYLVTIGAALFWGLLPSLRFGDPRIDRVWRVVTVTLLLVVVVQSWRFVDVRMSMFARGTETIDAIVGAGETYQGQRIIVVNAPSWFAQHRYEYVTGHFGVQLIPTYVGLDRVIYTSSDRSSRTNATSAAWQAPVDDGVYPFGPHGADTPPEELDRLLRAGGELIVVEPRGDRFVVRDVGRLDPERAEALPESVGRFAEGVFIDPARFVVDGDMLRALFTWHAVEADGEDYNAVAELRDSDGRVVGSFFGYPLAGNSAPRLWQDGDRLADSVEFAHPATGRYTLWLGLERVDGDGFAAVLDANGAPTDGNMLPIGAVEIP
jgi:hypothetical protein